MTASIMRIRNSILFIAFIAFMSFVNASHYTVMADETEAEIQNLLVTLIENVRNGNYEQTLEDFQKIETKIENSNQADYWFYRAVAEHQTFQKDACLASLQRLETLENIPVRFKSLAKLMKKDVEMLHDESLEMISRRMKSVERRLDSGATGENVQKSEEEIIKMLDKQIEDMEKKAQKQKRLSSSKKLRPSKAAKDARIMGGNGPGNVTRRDLNYEKSWGNLPEKEREEILQQLGRDFPPHYRDVIEQYFKKMAEQE